MAWATVEASPHSLILTFLSLPVHLSQPTHPRLVLKVVSDQFSILFKTLLPYDLCKKANSAWQTKLPRSYLCLISPSLFSHCDLLNSNNVAGIALYLKCHIFSLFLQPICASVAPFAWNGLPHLSLAICLVNTYPSLFSKRP